jgi:RimJ/RimL family protein N-acetyltransferase
VRHAFDELALEAVISIIDPDNARSIRVAEKLGMRRGAAHVHPRTRRRLLAYEISSHDAGFPPGAA